LGAPVQARDLFVHFDLGFMDLRERPDR